METRPKKSHSSISKQWNKWKWLQTSRTRTKISKNNRIAKDIVCTNCRVHNRIRMTVFSYKHSICATSESVQTYEQSCTHINACIKGTEHGAMLPTFRNVSYIWQKRRRNINVIAQWVIFQYFVVSCGRYLFFNFHTVFHENCTLFWAYTSRYRNATFIFWQTGIFFIFRGKSPWEFLEYIFVVVSTST